MNKNTIKKIILTIVILSVLILSLVFFYRITSENYSDDIKIVKKIINEKYSEIKYYDNSNYLYAYNKKDYTIYDYNGNKLYTIQKKSKEELINVSKKFYITKNDIYHLYKTNGEEITSGNNIYIVSDYLIFVDNNIIDEKGEVLLYDVKNIKPFYKNKYFSIDEYFINEKGKVLLYGYKIIKEEIKDNEIDYFIVKKDNKYYSFFPLLDNIVGDGFDKYFEYKNDIYIVSNNKIYMIYMNGLRKEITFVVDKNIYSVNYSNAVRKNRVLAIRDYYLGLLETDTNKFHKIVKTKDFSFKFIDDSNINISCNGKNYVYNLDNYEIVYKNNFDNIVVFDNDYKTLKIDNKYYLLDNNDRKITYSDKQIIILNSKIKIGKTNNEISLFDNNLYNGKRIIINKKNYYKYQINKTNYIVSEDLKEKYESDLYLNSMNNTIIKQKDNKLYFYNLKNGKNTSYNLNDYKIINDNINKNEIILSNNKNIIILNEKGKVIKKIRAKLVDYYYNDTKKSIILVVEKWNNLKGAYILK